MASLPEGGGGGLAFSFIFFSFFLSFSSFYQTLGAADQREFGYFVLSLLWLGTICQSTSFCCSSNACCTSSLSPTEFTIYGLWPNYDDDTWPACCSQSEFDIKKINPLINTLNKYWPTLSCSPYSVCHGGKGLFWAHEWEKHGTCSYPVIKDEYSYFSTTLKLYFKYNVKKTLIDAGYEPSNNETYPLGDIITTIKNAVGSLPLLVCSHGAVEELRICFFKDFKPRDCIIGSNTQDDMLGSRNSCPRYIRLPEYRPHYSLEDGNTALKRPSAILREELKIGFLYSYLYNSV